MNIVVNRDNRIEYLGLIDQSFKLRHKSPNLKNIDPRNFKRESDEFDTIEEVHYILKTNNFGVVLACLRLYPISLSNLTTVAKVEEYTAIPKIFDSHFWKCDKFVFSNENLSEKKKKLVAQGLIDSLCELGLVYEATKIQFVLTPEVVDVFEESNLEFCQSNLPNGLQENVGWFKPTIITLNQLRDISKFKTSQVKVAPLIYASGF
ncbi:MAG: hypothetical protein OCD03_11345 [Hyphomicrobiales bacterium]